MLTTINQTAKNNIKSDYFYPNRNEKAYTSVWDELPLWSAPFGLKLLEIVNYKKNIKVLDIGSGTGFPLIEIAQRLGETSEFYGIDPWETAIVRLKEKTEFMQLNNIKLFDCKSEVAAIACCNCARLLFSYPFAAGNEVTALAAA